MADSRADVRDDERDGVLTWRALLAEAAVVAGGRPQGRWVCEVASGLDGDELLDALDRPASERCVAHLDSMLERLRAGEPLQHVLGRWSFRHLDLMVDRRVLIPRPETEEVVDVALGLARLLPVPLTCADLGTGSGAIGLSLAGELPIDGTTVWMTDISSDALDVARANAAGLGRRAANVRFGDGSWFEALPDELRGSLALAVANPPYIAPGDPDLEPAVASWEPGIALYSDDDGMAAINVIVAEAPRWLRPGGWLVVEIGATQGSRARSLLGAAGLVDVEIRQDLAGRDRIAIARQPKRAAT